MEQKTPKINPWDTPEFHAKVEAMVKLMKSSASLCSASYFRNHGWDTGVGSVGVGNDAGYYWLATSLVARGYKLEDSDNN